MALESEFPPSTAEAPVWRPLAPQTWAWRRLDDEWLLRCDASGATHCLDAGTAALLDQFLAADGPLSTAALAQRLGEEQTPTADEVTAVERTLATLEQSGLLRRC